MTALFILKIFSKMLFYLLCLIVPGLWHEWEPWSLCSATCDGGRRYRNRTCDWESFGNLTTDCEGPFEEFVECHTFSCWPLGNNLYLFVLSC